jgi:16S rRNA (cytosine967-C5)-methyltransferase
MAMPQAFFDAVKYDWPNDYSKILTSLNHLPVIYLRVNTLLGFKPDQILERLISAGAKAEQIGLVTIKITNAFNLYSSEIFKEGAVEQQDIASQMVSEFLNPLPGDRIVDTCAGNGGKTLHLAALTQNKGKILSLDIYNRKIEEMRKRLRKAGVNNVEAKVIDSQKTIKRLYGTFNKVLIDAPCTGSGVYRRNPDAKYHFSKSMLQSLVKAQEEILEGYSKLAKIGGFVVFATCSVLKEEGEHQLVRFLNNNKSFVLVEEKRIMPFDFDCDGFYMAKLKRVE